MNTAAQWLGASSGILALVGVIISWPKTRGEGKKFEGEGELSAANARIAEQVATLQQTREQADRAEAARDRAEKAQSDCHEEMRRVRATANAAFDVFEDLIPLLPEEASRIKARQTLQSARAII